MHLESPRTKSVIFLWIYLMGMGALFLPKVISFVSIKPFVLESVSRHGGIMVKEAMSARPYVAEKRRSDYDVKIQEIEKTLETADTLLSGPWIAFDIAVMASGAAAAVLFIFAGIRVFQRSRQSLGILNGACAAFFSFYGLIYYEAWFVFFPWLRDLTALFSDLYGIADPQGLSDVPDFMGGDIAWAMGAGFLVYLVLQIVIPRFWISRPSVRRLLR